METQTLQQEEITEKFGDIPEDSGTEEDMAPQGNDTALSNAQNGGFETHEFGGSYIGRAGRATKFADAKRLASADDGEDGEILEDGEIASDEGEAANDGEVMEDDSKSSPSKKGHKEDRDRHRNKRDRHSKRRRSKEDGHRDKQQKKKRHREYVDYDQAGDDQDQAWSANERRDKGDRKGDRSPPGPYHSPSHDSHGEERGKHDKDGDKHRRGSGENRHHGSGRERDRNKDKDRNRDSRERSRDRHDKDKKDKHERPDKDKKERDRHKDPREKEFSRQFQTSDEYESPPGIYDSPSDEEFGDNRVGGAKPKTMMSLVEGEYMDPAMAANENEPLRPKNKKKIQKKKEWQERMRQREREREFDEEQPVKKKPLLQTPMEERPVCKFFKEGKCQKGVNCLFQHDYSMLPKRLELCRYYLKSYCRQEEECTFMHSEFPCKYFHTGSTCYQADNCKFSHAPLTAETEEALKNALNENEDEEHYDGYEGGRKHKKKGLLGDQPAMSEDEIHRKLEKMKSIPSIFDIETFAPGESPVKPKPLLGRSPSNIRPQGFYQDSNMSPQGGPNMRFNGPPNQATPPRAPFMPGPGGPGMDGPIGMQGPPMGGQGLMGPGPPPMAPQGPGMQGAPLGPAMNNPPMSQAAALVGAILRAAPMLQQYRGPAQQGPPTSMANNMNNNPRFMGQVQGGMGPMMPGQGPPPGMMSPGQDGMVNQGPGMQANQGQESFVPEGGPQQTPGMDSISHVSRDPRRNMGAQNDPRKNREMDGQKQQDVDMRTPGNAGGSDSMGDVDLRQDVDMRVEEGGKKTNQGNSTPQQEWDDNSENRNDDSDIPNHLPPKQREMFLRIKQHTMKINAQKTDAQKMDQRESTAMKADDDKWYSSDEDEETKPDISNILKSINQNEVKKEPGLGDSPSNSVSSSSSINVMQMINAIKSSTSSEGTTMSTARSMDPRLRMDSKPKVPIREPSIIFSHEGDCPWRLCRVLYTKERIPFSLEISDPRYKNDPRVQKFLKLQELESGMFIDHSKPLSSVPIKSESLELGEQKAMNLLDSRAIKKEPHLPRPELAPFVDPRISKADGLNQRLKSEMPSKPLDPRMKPGIDMKPSDPRAPKLGTHNLPVKPMDPRLSRQDSNTSTSIAMGAMGRFSDPRLARQNSREPEQSMGNMPRSSTPPMDPRQFNRQSSGSSGDPRLQRTDTVPVNVNVNLNKPFDPRLGRVMDSDIAQPLVQRQISQPSTTAEKDAASSNPNSKPRLDYRNDPRFKRKHISESNLPPETLGKKFTGQRKSSTEYSSPLGDEETKPEESGYNSYNRPRPQIKAPQTSLPSSRSFVDGENVSHQDITTHDILDSIQILPPSTLEPTQRPEKNLKEFFKTIDPTASPFC